MTARSSIDAPRRLVAEVLRTIRRVIRQTERRQRYRRLGWV